MAAERAIYYDGAAEGADRLARDARALIPPKDGHVRLRDARSWLQQPAQGIESFSSVVIPTATDFDALSDLYTKAGADVSRSDLDADHQTKPKPGAKRKE